MYIKKWRTLAFVSLAIMILPLMVISIDSHDIHENNNDSHSGVTYDLPLICRPKMGYLYVQDREIVNLGGRVTVVIGKITISCETRRDILFDRVEFWIDRDCKDQDRQPPYVYTWNEETIGWHILRVIAYKGERTLTDDLQAFFYNTERKI
jgi:hypothetical protein